MSPSVLKQATPVWPSAVWRADQLGSPVARAWPSGFDALDAELPGGGWPGHGLTELLGPVGGAFEWRLLGPWLRQPSVMTRPVVLVGPPHPPHPPGLQHAGLAPGRLVWLRADSAAERLWSAEQLLKGRTGAVLVAWLPQVRPAQLRRLQVLAAACEAPAFVCRPETAAREPSAAPLRLRVGLGPDWALTVDVFKRKGPPLARPLRLVSVPGGLDAVLPPRLAQPARVPVPMVEVADVVVRPVPAAGHALH